MGGQYAGDILCNARYAQIAALADRMPSVNGVPHVASREQSKAATLGCCCNLTLLAVLQARMKQLISDEVKAYFRPELLNRFDEQIVFHKLGMKEVSWAAECQGTGSWCPLSEHCTSS